MPVPLQWSVEDSAPVADVNLGLSVCRHRSLRKSLLSGVSLRALLIPVAAASIAVTGIVLPREAAGQCVIGPGALGGIDLATYCAPYANPETVNIAAATAITNGAGAALYSTVAGQQWNINISASSVLTGSTYGIDMAGSGTTAYIENYGTISGSWTGVFIGGDGGYVLNRGTINGYAVDGVNVASGYGSVVNGNGGIYAFDDGIDLGGGGYVYNSGKIVGSSFGGSTDGDGVYISGGTGGVVNEGAISSYTGSGIQLEGGGMGGLGPIRTYGSGYSVVNRGLDGSIIAHGGDGVSINGGADGSVFNGTLARIQGRDYGIRITNVYGRIWNNGIIAGQFNLGVALKLGGYVSNYGWIQGGVSITGGNGTVLNPHTIGIFGGENDGVYIETGYAALAPVTAYAAVFNYASSTIQSTGGDGVHIVNGLGWVRNVHYVSIHGDVNGVYVEATPGNVYNGASSPGWIPPLPGQGIPLGYGPSTIQGDYGDGVRFLAGGYVYNGGIISGGTYGVYVSGAAGEVQNMGTIDGAPSYGWRLPPSPGYDPVPVLPADGDGIRFLSGGYIYNGGTISGYIYSVNVTGAAGEIQNAGTIDGAIRLSLGNDVLDNRVGGVISGNISMSQGTDMVTNSGDIFGNIDLGPGDDVLALLNGSTIDGDIDGGADVDALSSTGNTEVTGSIGNFEFITINNGTLQLTDTLAVEIGGRLQGSGAVAGAVTNAGVLAPGNSIGTFNIDGDYVQTSQGSLEVEFSSTAADLLDITGTAALNGTLEILLQADSVGGIEGKTFTILLSDGGVVGQFDKDGVVEEGFWTVDISTLGNQVDATFLDVNVPLGISSSASGVFQSSLARAIQNAGGN